MVRRILAWSLLLVGGSVHAQSVPVMFVTQFPIAADFATIGSVFANHLPSMQQTGRGGDLYIRYPDGTLKNLTALAGYGSTGFQGANAIAVRDPAINDAGTKAVFSMVIGAPPVQYVYPEFYWQLYEVTGLGQNETPIITRVARQPADYNNIMPVYLPDDSIVFASDRPRNGARHLWPQHDEYESTATPTGLWKLAANGGPLTLLEHSPSGSFNPIVDRAGRIVFTRWDHLQRDQQNDAGGYGTFNFSSESLNATATPSTAEVFPEPRATAGTVEGFTINQFFPWMINADGSALETLNHLGRHELHSYFNRSFNDDPNLREFIASISGRTNPNSILNALQIQEDPLTPGRFYAIDAPEFYTHASGQIIALNAGPSANPDLVSVEYLTPREGFGTTPSPTHPGHFRDPLKLTSGEWIAAYTSYQGQAGNAGTRAAPDPFYKFRLHRLNASSAPYSAAAPLTAGISKAITFWDPDVSVSYSGPLWELSPVEIRARTAPPLTAESMESPELAAFAEAGVSVASFRSFLRAYRLGMFTIRDTTSRDRADRQQPFNLRVPGGVQTVGATGRVYDIAHFQLFQGDQIRGIGGIATPRAGRRVLAQHLNEANALRFNSFSPGQTTSVPIAADGSVAFVMPVRRALSWQANSPTGTPVVRERYWLSLQPGEIRACDGCHGVNQRNQANAPASQQTPTALREFLLRWKAEVGVIFADGVEG
jgi:hypothetical protein